MKASRESRCTHQDKWTLVGLFSCDINQSAFGETLFIKSEGIALVMSSWFMLNFVKKHYFKLFFFFVCLNRSFADLNEHIAVDDTVEFKSLYKKKMFSFCLLHLGMNWQHICFKSNRTGGCSMGGPGAKSGP